MRKHIIIIFLALLLPSVAQTWGPVMMGSGVGAAATADGLVGNKSVVIDGVFSCGNDQIPWSSFSASASGTVTYIYVRRYDATQNMAWIKPAIWTADGSSQLAVAADCSPTNPSTNLYRYTLVSSITITASTSYRLGYAAADTDYYPPYSATGAIYLDNVSAYTMETCPAPPAIVANDATYTTDGSLCIWASNDPNET